MDCAGIATTVVSPSNPWLDQFDGDDSADLARRLNAEMASYDAATGGRVLPMRRAGDHWRHD